MASQGWIKLHRKMLEWEWYDDANTFRLLVHLVLTANHERRKWRGVWVEAGQKITSYGHLATELKIGVQSVRTSLTKLKSTGEITLSTSNNFSLITLLNWKKHQEDNRPTNK